LFDADLEPALRGRRISAMVAPAEGALLFVRSEARDHNWFALTPRTDLDSIDPNSVATEAIPMIRSLVGVADLDITIRSAMTLSSGRRSASAWKLAAVCTGDAVGFDRELPIEDPAQPSGQPGTRAPTSH
jgi:putative polyketide hydroxylase